MNLEKWQSKIDDNADLFALNMPGTHDCAARYVQFSNLSRCQDRSIYAQLSIGIRVLDCRVRMKDGRLGMVHGIAKAFCTPNHFSRQMDLANVLSDCYRFLSENDGEIIVLQFKNDDGSEQEECFDSLYNLYIKGNEDKWFLENRSPKMSEVRGKIVLIRRCNMADRPEYNEKNTGIDFSRWQEQDAVIPDALPLFTGGESGMHFLIQDRYKYKPKQSWSECIKPFLDGMTKFDGTYVINYLSKAGGIKGPYGNARYINKAFMSYPLDSEKHYGIIYIDFPSPELAEKIISTNFN